jgi:hypothetical protein
MLGTSAVHHIKSCNYADRREAGYHTQVLCSDALPAAWVTMYAFDMDIEFVRELPMGCVEVLYCSGSAYAIGGHRTRT